MEYKVLIASDAASLSEVVNEAIRAGWMPQGGVAVTQYSRVWENVRKGCAEYETETVCAQAMVFSVS